MDGVILMGPFGSGKTHLGHALQAADIATYVELEPVVYARFGNGDAFDLEGATDFIRAHYYERLASGNGPHAFESTGVTQRPLVLQVQAEYEVELVRVVTPRPVCLDRVAARHQGPDRAKQIENAARFFDFWTQEVAPSYHFRLEVSGIDEAEAVHTVATLLRA